MIKLCKIIVLLAITLCWASNAAADGKYASIVVDAASGKVLEATNAQAARHPASITKVMTLYLTFKALHNGSLRINQALPVSEFAAAQAPSKLGLTPGSAIRVRDAILALVTQSANDAAVVLAEALGGTESGFAKKMTEQARQLGMANTTYRNASGLPDDAQITTARDMAILARAVYFNFPDYYRYFSTASFTYGGRVYKNHNHLMQHYRGMDGIKTGYIRASGFNLIASAVRGNTRLIAVIFGGNTAKERDRAMAALLDGVFNKVARNAIGRSIAPPLVAQKTVLVPQPAEGDSTDDETETTATPEDPAAKPAAAPPAITPAVTIVSVTPPAPTIVKVTPTAQPVATTAASPVVKSITAAIPPLPQQTPAAAKITLASAATIPPNTPDGIKLLAIKPSLKPAPAAPNTEQLAAETKQHWAIQLGAYSLRNSAEQTIKKAQAKLPKPLATARHQVVAAKTKKHTVYRAQFTTLDEATARKICHTLGRKFHCEVLRPAPQHR